MHKSAATVAGKARRFYYSKDINRRWRVERGRQGRCSLIMSVVATLLIQITLVSRFASSCSVAHFVQFAFSINREQKSARLEYRFRGKYIPSCYLYWKIAAISLYLVSLVI